jgi:hypothetical protein
MRIEGEALDLYQALFPHGLVPQILQLMVDAWNSFRHPTNDEDEPKITNRYVKAMRVEGRRRGARFRVESQYPELEQLDPDTGKGFGLIDICVPYGYESRCYFGIEAKKLNTSDAHGKPDPNAREYAGDKGMGRFVSGRYSGYQCEGAMVGYVMDADCTKARASISKAIDERARELRVPVSCPLHPAQALPNHPDAFETRHALDRGEFTLHHVLLAA